MSNPAGWYPQPDGQQRYWDGGQWTENFAPGVPPVTPPVTARKNWLLRHKVLTAIGALFLIGMLSNAIGGSGSGSTVAIAPAGDSIATSAEPDKAAADKAAADATAAQAAVDKQAAADKVVADKAAVVQAAADKAAAKAAAAPQLGKKVLDGKFAFTVTGLEQHWNAQWR